MSKESQNIEWKQSWHDEYLKWICGFANAQGGRIYIGKDDDGVVVGLKDYKKLLEDLPNKIRDQLGLMPHINLLQEDKKAYIEITVEKLFQTHRSIPRNPLIAEVCYRVGYIDSWGRGIEKIIDACRHAGLPKPVIEENSGGIAIELLKAPASAKDVSESRGDDFGTILDGTSGKRRVSVGKTSGMILDVCRDNPSITIPQMAEKIGVTERSVQRNIQKLQTDGLLRRVGGRKEGHWKVVENDEG